MGPVGGAELWAEGKQGGPRRHGGESQGVAAAKEMRSGQQSYQESPGRRIKSSKEEWVILVESYCGDSDGREIIDEKSGREERQGKACPGTK